MNSTICRIGVFYDGSYVTKAQNYFCSKQKGWLYFTPFHELIKHFIEKEEPGYSKYKIVYAYWHQGLFPAHKAEHKHLEKDRKRDIDLLKANIQFKPQEVSELQGEKGVDVALALDALELGIAGKIDVAVLVTGDGDFVPLVKKLAQYRIRVATVYFEYKNEHNGNNYESFVDQFLKDLSDYYLDINSLEGNPEYTTLFHQLFRKREA